MQRFFDTNELKLIFETSMYHPSAQAYTHPVFWLVAKDNSDEGVSDYQFNDPKIKDVVEKDFQGLLYMKDTSKTEKEIIDYFKSIGITEIIHGLINK